MVEWIDRAVTEPAVDFLPDEQVLAVCEAQLDEELQEELSDLLARKREGQLSEADRGRLDALMQVYRRGLVRKAQAWKVAVARGLKPPLN